MRNCDLYQDYEIKELKSRIRSANRVAWIALSLSVIVAMTLFALVV